MSLTPDASNPAVTDPNKRIGDVLAKDHSDVIRPGAHAAWSLAAAGWLTIMAVPLLLFPRVLSLIFGTLLAEMGDPETHEKPGADVLRTLNILERSLAGLAGLSCFALAALLLVQSGTIPFTGSLTDSRDLASSPAAAPYRSPSIWIAAAFFGGLAYTTYNIGLVFLAAPSVGLCAWGLWVLFFGHEGRVNQASAKASSFPFTNVAAEEKKAETKQARKEQ
ncbi:hypothetical protein Rhopal_004170-T1 [Rhodotorula paludigena]|uniref:Uncharacterized protein n=1 Tax=Rhodotorula paludigena TaxID=86838 RepID=A0AAV5GP53_9BASI|nr:hypothetical protein Rhopal_004170-T1 [Rhodotorula paludigena]